jgi:hypothetical protein
MELHFPPKGFQGADRIRICQDYHCLNSATVKNRTPIRTMVDLLDAARGFSMCSSVNLASGYHQIPLTQEEIPWPALHGTNQLHDFITVFGCTNPQAGFQTALQTALSGQLGKFVLVYEDDALVF